MRIITQCCDFLFPPRADELLLRNTDQLPLQRNNWQSVEYLHNFREPVIRAAITENKYQNNQHAKKLLARSVQVWHEQQTKPTIFIPIPLSHKREKERGYNQVTEVLHKSNELKLQILTKVLIRKKHTKPQTSLRKTEREQNLKNAFAIKNANTLSILTDTLVVLVDDVVTTGATLEAARKELSPHIPSSCSLQTLAFAH